MNEIAVRRAFIVIHGIFGVWVGIAMILTGAPPPAEAWFGPEVRYVLGFSGLAFGALAIYGTYIGDDREPGWSATAVAMVGLTFWHAAMMAIYTAHAASGRGRIEILGPDEIAMTDQRPYIPFVYMTLMMLTAAHALALKRFGRPGH